MTKANGKEDPFAAFRLPLGVTEGVIIDLGSTGGSFRVSLPSQANDEFQMRFMAAMNVKVDDDNQVVRDFDPAAITAIRRKVFFKHCILEANGLPEGMTADAFFAKYPLAAKHVFERATMLAQESDVQVEAAMGNLGVSWNGKSPGRATKPTTPSSSSQDSPLEIPSLNSAA